ncbi:MAG: GNAT family N-acetyltransferase [Rickettsiales bacterium]|nr:GNAT family N-acetyltransferase [Rickettsiales bacterium]
MTIAKITDNKIQALRENISPNVICNRFDIKYGDGFDLWKIGHGAGARYIATHMRRNVLEVSLHMSKLPDDVFMKVLESLFDNYRRADRINIDNCMNKISGVKPAQYWRIDLPPSIEALDRALSRSVRYNTRRYPNKIRETFGGFEIRHFTKEQIPWRVMAEYFRLKKISHNRSYRMSYLDDYFVTDCWVLYVGSSVASIVFVSDTPPNAYLENITYNPDFAKYSAGMVLFYHVICELIESGHEQFYLLGGDMEYKRHFNGIMTDTYSCQFSRKYFSPSLFMSIVARTPALVRKIVRGILPHRKDKTLLDMLAARH